MRHVGRDTQHLPLRHHDLAALELELQRAFHNISNLLAFVTMLRHHRALGEKHLGDHGFIACYDAARDNLAHHFFLHVVPRVMFHAASPRNRVQPKNITTTQARMPVLRLRNVYVTRTSRYRIRRQTAAARG